MSSGEIFAAAFEAASSGLLLVEKSTGRVFAANRAFVKLCGRARSQIMGQSFWEAPLAAEPEAAAEARTELNANGRLENTALPLETGEGSLLLVEVSGQDVGGERVFLELRDITGREGARLAERLAAERQMASRAAGEFAELQEALQSAAKMLSEPAAPLQKACERAETIVRELRACAGELSAQPERLQLNELVDGMHLTLQRRLGPDIEVLLELGEDVAPVRADAAHLRQIILNLATNSREAMERGFFRIQTRNSQAGDPVVGTGGGTYAVLTISDDGPGMDDQSWEHLYEPFFTTKGHGQRGLGLAAVHGMVRQNGGHIWAQSEPGLGTTFEIYLPQCEAGRAAAAPREQADRAAVRTILLMEPNDGLRGVVSSILKKRGYRVWPAREAKEALEIAKAQGAPDLLISEPAADLAKRMAALRPGLRILLLNGHSPRAKASGAATLAKPFELEALLGKVRELLADVQ